MKVILADDHTLFRDGFALLLKQSEAETEVLEAASLAEALAQVARHSDADLLLLDLAMPGMNGETSVRRVLASYPELPVVIMSASESRDQVEALLDAGVSGYIPKSSTSQVMLSAIHLVVAGGVYIPPQFLTPPTEFDPEGEACNKGFPELTERQVEVLRLVAEGMPNKAICRVLNVSEGTVKVHLYSIFRVLGVGNRTEAVTVARRLKLMK